MIEITSRAPVTSEAPAHASSTTSSAVTSPRADDVIAQLRNHEVGLYNGDVNIPSDSYFTGDEEIPIWNAVGHVPLLDATTTTTTTTITAAANDDDDDGSRLLELGRLMAQFLSYITASGYGVVDSAADNGKSRDVISLHKLMTPSPVLAVTSANAGYRSDGQASSTTTTSTRLQDHVPLTTSLSPQTRTNSRQFTTTTPPLQSTSLTYPTASRDQSHVLHYQNVAMAVTPVTIKHVGKHTSPSNAEASSHHVPARHHKQAAAAVVPNHARAGPTVHGAQLGGFGPWGGRGTEMDYFFDYVVDYQTPRPPRRRLRLKTGRQRNRVKPARRVKHHDRSSGTVYTWPLEPRPAAVNPGSRSQNVVRPFGRSQHRGRSQTVPVLIIGDQPQRKIHGSSALHDATDVNQNQRHRPPGVRYLKKGTRRKTLSLPSSTQTSEQ